MDTRVVRAKRHGCKAGEDSLCRWVKAKRVVRLKSLLGALKHAYACGAEMAQFVSKHTQTFVAYRPSYVQPGKWRQCVYSEHNGYWITDRKWVWASVAPGLESDQITMLIHEEQAIQKAIAEEAALEAASRPGPNPKVPRA